MSNATLVDATLVFRIFCSILCSMMCAPAKKKCAFAKSGIYSRTATERKCWPKAFWIYFSTLPPISSIFSNFSSSALKQHLPKRHLTLSKIEFGLAPLQKIVGDFCCRKFGGFCRGSSWRIFLGTFSHKNEEKKSGDKLREKIRRIKNKNPQKIRSAKNLTLSKNVCKPVVSGFQTWGFAVVGHLQGVNKGLSLQNSKIV